MHNEEQKNWTVHILWQGKVAKPRTLSSLGEIRKFIKTGENVQSDSDS
jgi:hypothetical protein